MQGYAAAWLFSTLLFKLIYLTTGCIVVVSEMENLVISCVGLIKTFQSSCEVDYLCIVLRTVFRTLGLWRPKNAAVG